MIAYDGAKLFGPVIPGHPSRKRKQSFAISSSKNYTPPLAKRIHPCWIGSHLHFSILILC
ncbi:MAG TPA: hypothetical protein VIJ38_13090 [Acidobacteriaceae bacterium]